MSENMSWEANVRASKAQYELSKEELRTRLTVMPAASERLSRVDVRLAGLEQQAAALRAEIRMLASKAAYPSRPDTSKTRSKVLNRSVSFDTELERETSPQGEEKKIEAKRRSSCFTSQSFADCETVGLPNGRVVELNTHSALLGPLECIIAEPMGKQLQPDVYVATGLVICIHGHPPTKEILEEWGATVKQAHWLELGLSVAMPNLQMSSALTIEDLECVVEATLKLLDLGTCVVAGKGWGALKAVELAASQRLAGKIEGVILAAPSSPPPMACSSCSAPALIMWARDDDVEAFQESQAWMEALCTDEREAPTTLYEAPSGGHQLHRVLERDDAMQALQNFTAASILHADLLARKEGQPWSERANRLFAELPGFLRDLGLVDQEGGNAEDAESLTETDTAGRRLSDLLPQWIESGMPTSSE